MPTLNIPSYENISEIGTIVLSTIGVRPFIDFMENDLEEIIFDTNCFAELCLYKHYTGEQTSYKCLVNNPNYSANIGTEVNISDREMMIRMQESKLLRYPRNEDEVKVRNIKYNVSDIQPDGVGTISLILKRAGYFDE